MTHKRTTLRQNIKIILDGAFQLATDPAVYSSKKTRFAEDDLPVIHLMVPHETSERLTSDGDYSRHPTILITAVDFSTVEAVDDKLDGVAERIEAAVEAAFAAAAIPDVQYIELVNTTFIPELEGADDFASLILEYRIRYHS